jgi:hypothetical protein
MTNDLHEKLQQRKYKQNFTIPDENIIFTINGKNIGCTQSFVCMQGLPKAGKSLFITSAISSAFTPYDIFGMKINFPIDRKKICYCDTESSDFDYYNVLERIRLQIGLTNLPAGFDSFLFREDSPKDILDMLEIYLSENLDCSILVIDGILDIISDFNSVEQSFFLIQWLKKITKVYNILVLCVLHLGKKDQNSIGHIGSYLDRKAQSVLKIEKNKEKKTIDLMPQFLRSTDDFDTISIQYVGNRWEKVQSDPVDKSNFIFGMEKISLLNRILPDPKKYAELLTDLIEFTGKGQTTCKKILKDWILDNTIQKVGDYYKIKTKVPY